MNQDISGDSQIILFNRVSSAYFQATMKDPIHNQLDHLQDQLQLLHRSLERLPEQIAAIILAAQEVKQPASVHASSSIGQTHGHGNGHTHGGVQVEEEHHSFLIDEDMVDVGSRSYGHDIAPEAQVQRLTAQLTAAYNRIAALEEQLLSQRMSQ